MTSELGKVMVCPECKKSDFKVIDKVDYNVEVIECLNCGWQGTTDELVSRESE